MSRVTQPSRPLEPAFPLDGSIDLVIASLGADPAATMRCLQATTLPTIAVVADLVPGPQTLSSSGSSVAHLLRADALVPERLVRAVRSAVRRRPAEASAWHAATGLPSPSSLRVHLASTLQRAERELKRVALVMVRAPLPRAPVSQPWAEVLQGRMRFGDYVAVAAADQLALVVFGIVDPVEDALARRFQAVVESQLGLPVQAVRQFLYPEHGRSVDELLGGAIAALSVEVSP